MCFIEKISFPLFGHRNKRCSVCRDEFSNFHTIVWDSRADVQNVSLLSMTQG
jgi:hypothetical protein